MDASIWINALVTLIIAGGGVGGTIYASKKTSRSTDLALGSTDRNASIDQLQEDLKEMREELDRVNQRAVSSEERAERKARHQDRVIRTLEDEVSELRKVLQDAGLTPPPRRSLPPYPGEWTVTDTRP